MDQDKIRHDVLLELSEMKRIGVNIPESTFELAKTSDLEEYECMSTSEIVDLLIDLSI